ncbi:MAG: hypothetical protein JST70_01965 [Bacteroidetes bacterium]|nr:hypothetical protein [Bacteroidota bacterium]
MTLITTTLKNHIDFSIARLKELEDKVKGIKPLEEIGDLCIYVTGSFGRFEATHYSDLDLFFISSSEQKPVSRLTKTLIDAELISIAEKMKFPPFSNDGQFLEIHYLDSVKEHLGSPNDDFSNFFTARLLLLLESYPVVNSKYYDSVIKEIIQTYYRDFHDHREFKPTFLVNDIIRYWKTLCLNYEHRRNRPVEDETKKLKTHVKNLKLVFSRKLTCFSLILSIVSKYNNLSEDALLEYVKLTPVERLDRIAKENPSTVQLVKEIFELYSYFIELNNQTEKDLLEWMKSEDNKKEAFEKGRKEFGTKLFQLLIMLVGTKDEILKFLVI